MRGSFLGVVGLILLFTTLTEGSAFRHHTRKKLKSSFNPSPKKTDRKTPTVNHHFVADECNEKAVLITGDDTAELYLPSSARHLPLTRLPEWRVEHSVSNGGLLCGGEGTWRSTCRQWTSATGSWEMALNLDVVRNSHVSWTPEDSSGTYLMGGGSSFDESMSTTTLITPDGSQKHGFFLKYLINGNCAIPDPITDTVVVTGGGYTGGIVVRYGKQGWLEDLPDLITGRGNHACSSFMSSGRLIYLVTGGDNDDGGYNILDSTEILDLMKGRWLPSGAKLPNLMTELRAVNFDGRVLIFGGFDDTMTDYDDILEYDPEGDTMTTVGHMTRPRSMHAISVVQAADYLPGCQ